MLHCTMIQWIHQRETVIDKHVKTPAPNDRQHHSASSQKVLTKSKEYETMQTH